MGARHIEFAIGCWLMMSPFVFGHAETPRMWTDIAWGAVVMVLSLICYVRPLHRAHLALLGVGAWLFVDGWLATRGDVHPGWAQNEITTGLLLAMVAIVPSHATDLPTGWRDRVRFDDDATA